MKYNRNIFEECVSSFQDDSFKTIELIYDDYIGNNKEIRENINKILTSKGVSQIQALPGGGKSTTLVEIANEIGEPIAILNPTRVLVCQLARENKDKTKMARVIGAKGGKVETITKDAIVYSCSYEMLVNLVRDGIVKRVIVDEAHNLVWAKYRDFENLEETLKKMETVVYCTATPNALANRKIDTYLNLKKRIETSYAKSYQLYFMDARDKSIDDIYAFIVNCKNKNLKPMIRVNNSEGIEDIINTCKEIDINGLFINSTQKKFDTIDDKEIFENIMMDGLVNHSGLVEKIDGVEVDFWLSTCIIDQGVNIKCLYEVNNVNGERVYTYSNNLENVCSLFVVNKPEELNIDYILQYKDRLRDSYSEFGILLKKQDKVYSIESNYLEFYNKNKKVLNNYITFITSWIEDNKGEDILALWEDVKNNKDMLCGIMNDFNGAIKIVKENDEYKAIIDEDKYAYNTLMEYYERFYYNTTMLKEFFPKDFNEDIYLKPCDLKIYHDEGAKLQSIKEDLENCQEGAFRITNKGKEADEVKQIRKDLEKCGYTTEQAKQEIISNITTLDNIYTSIQNEVYNNLMKMDDKTIKDNEERKAHLENNLKMLVNIINAEELNNFEKLMKNKLEICGWRDTLEKFVKKGYDLEFFINNIGKDSAIERYFEDKRLEAILEANTRGKRDLLPEAQTMYAIIDKIALKKGDKLRLYTMKKKTKNYDDASKRIQDAYEELKKEYPKIKTYKNFCKLLERIYIIEDGYLKKTIK